MFSLISSELQIELENKFEELVEYLKKARNKKNYKASRAINYAGRKSEEVSRIIIRCLTESESTIYDPCFGSGTFLIAASKEGRKSIGCELDNYIFNVFRILYKKIDKEIIDDFFLRIKEKCYDDVMELYKTKCCSTPNYIERIYFDPESNEFYNPENHREIRNNNKNVKLIKKCPVCGKKYKRFSDYDMSIINEVSNIEVDRFPSHKLIPNSRINITPSENADRYDATFNHRSKVALLKIQDSISDLPDSNAKVFLQFTLVSALALSRIVQYGSSTNYLYQVMKYKAQESNVWVQFERKYKDMVKYKYEDLINLKQDDFKIINSDCKSLNLDDLGIEEPVDLIYTDPPYTDQNPYLERHQLFRDWLAEFFSEEYRLDRSMLENEIVITNSPERPDKNSKEQYFSDIKELFNSCYEILKKHGIMVIHLNLAIREWLEIYNRFRNQVRAAGFEPIFRYDIKNKNPTIRKQSAKANTNSMEIILFLLKLNEDERFWYVDDLNLDRDIYFYVSETVNEGDDVGYDIDKIITKCQEYLRNRGFHEHCYEINKIHRILKRYFTIEKGTIYNNDEITIFDDYTKEAVLRRIIDITPVTIRKLLENRVTFRLDDLLINLSYKLDNGNIHAIEELVNNRTMIYNILDTLCIKRQDGYYRREISSKQNRDSIDIATIEGEYFESIIVELLKEEGFSNVFKTPRTRDRGVDIYAEKEDEKWMFQVKRWVNKVGSSVIQRLHSMKINNNYDFAECITTSSYTSDASSEAEECNIMLTNGNKIIERLNIAFPGKYYHSLIDFNN